ncbi:branched-chain amino acid ABC transporter permease [bacterium]|nr:branched-chain amino acid ABC transporter permease [bacterium]
MDKALQTFIDALAVGSLYALIALGYTMVYGTLKFINFAHSTVFMLGAWGSYLLARSFGWTESGVEIPLIAPLLILPTVMVACSLLGFIVERVAYRPLRKAPRLNVLITAIGVALLLENTAALDASTLKIGKDWLTVQVPRLVGTQPQSMPSLIPNETVWQITGEPATDVAPGTGVALQLIDVLIVGTAATLMIALQWLVYGTKLGSAMRAVSQDMRTASLLGINVDRTISFTFVVGSALAAAAGFLFAIKYSGLNQPSHPTWVLLGLKAFVAAVVGGIGNIRGAVVGGLLIGFIELFGAAYLSAHLRDLYVFSILIFTLLAMPAGIFGKATIEKV